MALGEPNEKSQSKSNERLLESKFNQVNIIPRKELPQRALVSYEDFEFENQIELQVEGMQIARRNKSQSKIHTIEY